MSSTVLVVALHGTLGTRVATCLVESSTQHELDLRVHAAQVITCPGGHRVVDRGIEPQQYLFCSAMGDGQE